MKYVKKLFDAIAGKVIIFLAWSYALFVFRVFNRVKIIGRENIPSHTNVLYVSNHQTLADSFLIALGVVRLKDVIFWPSKIPWNSPDKQNFFGNPLIGFFFKYLKNVPVTRGVQGKQVLYDWLKKCSQVLRLGRLVIFFEGTRTRDGNIGECKSGLAELIYENKPTVVPILIENIQSIMPLEENIKEDFKNFIRLRFFRKGRMIIGKPIVFNGAFELPKSQARKQIALIVRNSVIDLKTTS